MVSEGEPGAWRSGLQTDSGPKRSASGESKDTGFSCAALPKKPSRRLTFLAHRAGREGWRKSNALLARKLLVEREIQLQHIYSRLSQKSEVWGLGVPRN